MVEGMHLDLTELRQTAAELKATRDTASQIKARRDTLVCEARRAGARWEDLEAVPGLSRKTVTNILRAGGLLRGQD